MAFTDLSTNLQNIIMFNFETFAKYLIIFGLFIYCLYISKTFDPKEKSPFISIRYIKGLSFLFSKVYLALSPLMIFLLFPQVRLDSLLIILTTVYGALFGIFAFVIVPINVLLYGSSFAFDLLGVQNRTQKIRKEVSKITGSEGGLP